MTDSQHSICTRHPERQAIGTCESCGKNVCEECALKEEDKTICPLCLDKKESLETLVQKDIRITIMLTQRFKTLGIGLGVGAVFSLLVAGLVLPSGYDLSERALAWAWVMGGPIVGTVSGMPPLMGFGWLGMPMALAHPVRPNPVTKGFTIFGLSSFQVLKIKYA